MHHHNAWFAHLAYATLTTMLSRTITSSLALLLLAIFLLANCSSSPQSRSTLPLTPPPISTQIVRIGPFSSQPTSSLTTTPVASATAVLASTPVVTATDTTTHTTTEGVMSPVVEMTPTTTPIIMAVTASPTISRTGALTRALVITPTPVVISLPTVTPTPLPDLILLPTPTPVAVATVASPATPPSMLTAPTPFTEAVASTVTSTITSSSSLTATAITTNTEVELPLPFMTVTLPLPPAYEAQGSFASQTVYTNGTIAQQQGSFSIRQSAAPNAYGANQHYTLRTENAAGELEEINVYQIDEYVAVKYTGGDWMLARRDQGSNIVRAIQPLTDLALLFPRIINQAEFVGPEEIGGIPTLRYRLDDPAGQEARLIQPLLALTGEIRSLKLEVWIAVPGGYVAAYNFQVELAGARVLDADRNQVRADQAVTWTYQIAPNQASEPIPWPADAPTPDAFPVPGFAAGDFPLPPNTELLTLAGGVPDLVSTLTPLEIDSFYRSELFLLGWSIEGEGGLLHCSKDGASFQLLIAEDEVTRGTRISILPGG